MDSQRLHKGSSSCTSIVWLVIFLNHDYNDCLGLNFVKMLLTKLTLKCYLFQVLYGKEPLIGRDENEREWTGNYLSRFRYHIFLPKTGAGAGKAAAKTVTEYVGIRK
jgi:hypothetical protein